MNTRAKLAFMTVLAGQLSFSALADPVGMVQTTDGTVVVVKTDGKRRIVSPGSNLDKGDSLQTEKESTAKLRFSDGSEMIVRPSSAVLIQDYHYQQAAPDKDTFVVGLLRGALRQITGFIGKRGNQDAYKLRSGTATIGIRGTDFTARLCSGNDCQDVKRDEKKTKLAASAPVVAKVAEFKGRVTALPRSGLRRELTEGAAIYQDDILETEAGAYAAIAFSDQSRVVLPADSSFRVSSYRHVPDQPEKGNMFFDLLKGSFRMVTGLIGKAAPKKVNVSAGTVTIGIRGTSFDLACVPANIPNPEGFAGGGTGCSGGGLYTATRDGAISVTTADGNEAVFGSGQSSYVPGPNQAPILLKFSPEFLKALPGPLPEHIKIDIQGLFGIDAGSLGDAGLYVTVSDGKIIIAQASRELLLETGESGFAPGTGLPPQRLITPPSFLIQDKSQTQQNIGFRSCRM